MSWSLVLVAVCPAFSPVAPAALSRSMIRREMPAPCTLSTGHTGAEVESRRAQGWSNTQAEKPKAS
jgi:hypothetical protein